MNKKLKLFFVYGFLTAFCLAVVMTSTSVAATSLDELEQRLAKLEEGSSLDIGGALRVNYGYQDWSETDKDKGGNFAFDLFRLNVDAKSNKMFLSAEYRWYPEYGFDTIHHGYVGYNFTESLQGQVGIHQVPFGIQPYASHNFWFSGAYYLGLEDDYDMGLKLLYEVGQFDLTAAFYKNAELGSAGNANRYSVDVNPDASGGYAGAQTAGNEETNQLNLRGAYTFEHNDSGNTEVGVSLEYGQLYNNNNGKRGDHDALAVHAVGNYGPVNIQLELVKYSYDPENPAGFDDNIITVGSYGYSWGMPAEAVIAIANIAYTLPIKDCDMVDSLTFYSDNTFIEPKSSPFGMILQNVVGVMAASGPVYSYLDVISAEDMIFSGGNMVGTSEGRTTRVNLNVGYYF